ncbi:MAG: 2-octaprenyl-6-methoxyphenyl hydroxylase [Colwellia sp.]
MTHKNFDIVISGGGLSGSLMALSLAKLTKADGSLLSIAIIETNRVELNHPDNVNKLNSPNKLSKSTRLHETTLFDDRVLALSHGSAKYLESVGAWQFLSADACAIKTIDISDRGHYGKARLNAADHKVNALGYVVEMALIGKAQLKALNLYTAKKANIHWFSPDSITDIDWLANSNGECITIKLASNQQLHTSLLLACDGAKSPCRELANIDTRCSDYNQVALIANVATQKPHQNKAYERFTEHGPIAMLPLASLKNEVNKQSRCSLVWTMSPEAADKIRSLNDDDFKQALELAFGSWLGEITQVGKRDVYPLVLLQASKQIYHRLALIGNASHTIHPIAGQGFNLGVRDIEKMSVLIANALKLGQDIGSFSSLNNYAQHREKDHNQVIELTDSLVTLFSNNLPPLVAGRNIALKVLNYCSPLKNALVKKTMGY